MTVRCRECDRPLRRTSPDGYGPVCRRRINAQPDPPPPSPRTPRRRTPHPDQLTIEDTP